MIPYHVITIPSAAQSTEYKYYEINKYEYTVKVTRGSEHITLMF